MGGTTCPTAEEDYCRERKTHREKNSLNIGMDYNITKIFKISWLIFFTHVVMF
jgi:hypothetical protein